MDQVGVRELKQNASAVLRRVKAGESIEVTERGRPVARLIPARPMSPVERLIAEGRATPPEGDLLEHMRKYPPMAVPPGQPLASEILAEMRADER